MFLVENGLLLSDFVGVLLVFFEVVFFWLKGDVEFFGEGSFPNSEVKEKAQIEKMVRVLLILIIRVTGYDIDLWF